MRLWKRPSIYLAALPVLGIAAGAFAHWVMGCGYECAGPMSGPIDRVALFLLYLFGYGIWVFWGIAAVTLLAEALYQRWRARAA
jgi:hypothetical protein